MADQGAPAPLHIAVYFDPDSKLASGLARFLFAELMAASGGVGARIPVTYHASRDAHPVEVSHQAAEHVLSIVLVDAWMSARAGGQKERVDRWAAWLVNQLNENHGVNGPHAVLPVALDQRAFDLDRDALGETAFVRLDRYEQESDSDYLPRQEELLFATCVAALRLLNNKGASPGELNKAPLKVFLSHAKGDLSTGSLDAIRSYLSQGPVDGWYDAADIDKGTRFSEAIIKGIQDCAVMIAVVTDGYASREWCRREVLEAKRARRPLVIVDDIRSEEARSFPYLGNALRIRWHEGHARYVVNHTIKEALTHSHHLAVNARIEAEDDLVLGASPELLTVVGTPAKRILYPDPPLDLEELRELERSLGEGFPMTTPLEQISQSRRNEWIGLSMSTAQDAERYGGSPEHLALLARDLNLLLLRAGCKIGYGGLLGAPELTKGKYNFTELLLELMRAHVTADPQEATVLNFIGWPIYLGKDKRQEAISYPLGTDFEWVDPPTELGIDPALLNAKPNTPFPPSDAPRRFAWSRGMTAMREYMNTRIAARVILGGKMSQYVSSCAGVVEEALLALGENKPVYVIGAFGGAARLMFDAVQGIERDEFTTAWTKGKDKNADGEEVDRYPHFDEIHRLYADAGFEIKTPEELGEEFAALGKDGLAAAFQNGLDDQENRELGTTGNPIRMVELILRGLDRVLG